MTKKKKIRADFRKNRTVRARTSDWTGRYRQHGFEDEAPPQSERISGKGDLTRRRTVHGDARPDETGSGFGVQLTVDESICRRGRVLNGFGLLSVVEDENGIIYHCATRRILKTLATDQRHVVAAGDRVLFRPVERSDPKEGIIERVEPRHGCICRAVRGRQHVLVANVDQLAIIASAAEPRLKPHLIDRLLITAEKGGVHPLICINKIDLADPADLQPLVGAYGQMGYDVLLLSAKTGFGIERFRLAMLGRANVVAGQSGVGKSSLLNALDPNLQLDVQPVSEDTEKGKHTTTAARLLPLAGGGYVVDTPGMRQFQLWDVTPEEVAGFYRDVRPYVHLCHFPDCTHTHEADCSVKNAVADGRLDERRYESYCHLFAGDAE
jgi:ribosome biogenesis GTPase / thiamine phosphate phosphatase